MRQSNARISSFKELMTEISYSWEYPTYDIYKYDNGMYSLNKLYITKTTVEYKTDTYELAPGVFESFERFYKFLKREERLNKGFNKELTKLINE